MIKDKAAAPFAVGDKVTTAYWRGEETIVRTVLAVNRTRPTHSDWSIITDGGERCEKCGRKGREVSGVYGGGIGWDWFHKVKEAK